MKKHLIFCILTIAVLTSCLPVWGQPSDPQKEPKARIKSLKLKKNKWTLTTYRYDGQTWQQVLTEKANVVNGVLILQTPQTSDNDTDNKRYIVEYNKSFKAKLFLSKRAAGMHIESNMQAAEGANVFISIKDTNPVDTTLKEVDYEYRIMQNFWNDYQIRSDDSNNCGRNGKPCRKLESENSLRKRTKSISIGAVNDMIAFRGHKLRFQFMIETTGKIEGQSYIKVKEACFYFFKKAALKQAIEKSKKQDDGQQSTKQINDDGQSGPRRPPRG